MKQCTGKEKISWQTLLITNFFVNDSLLQKCSWQQAALYILYTYLQYLAPIILREGQLLLIQGVQRSPGYSGFLFLYTVLAVDQVYLDIRGYKQKQFKTCNWKCYNKLYLSKIPSQSNSQINIKLKPEHCKPIRTGENFGSGFWDETSGPDDLHLQMVLPVIETELDLPQASWAQDLSTHQLGRPQAVYEVPKLPLGT